MRDRVADVQRLVRGRLLERLQIGVDGQELDAFDLGLSTEAIVIVMLGGQGTIAGPALGAYLYEELRGWLLTSDTFANFQLVVSGVLLLVIVLFAPGGLMGWLYQRWPSLKRVIE